MEHVTIMSLWLPILLSAVFVFIVSSVVHMFLTYHNKDFKPFPNETAAADALRNLNLPEGDYLYPIAGGSADMRKPEFQEKMLKGPLVRLNIAKGGPMTLGPLLGQWFIYSLVVGVFAAYISGRALGIGAPYLQVFRFAGCTAFACYVIAGWQESIWWRRPWSVTLRNTIDGLIYALVTAGTFGWLWPR